MASNVRSRFGARSRDWMAFGLGIAILLGGIGLIVINQGSEETRDIQLTVGGEPQGVLDLVPKD
ncbi:MAG: hypothetical protein AAF416_00560 [Pseudomonadota bacterium]